MAEYRFDNNDIKLVEILVCYELFYPCLYDFAARV